MQRPCKPPSLVRIRTGAPFILLALALAAPVEAAESGIASVYANRFAGRKTASGARLSLGAMTAAHRRLPFGTLVRVAARGRSIVVRITDRGPFVRGRIIDLTPGAARALGFSGLLAVSVVPIGAGPVPIGTEHRQGTGR